MEEDKEEHKGCSVIKQTFSFDQGRYAFWHTQLFEERNNRHRVRCRINCTKKYTANEAQVVVFALESKTIVHDKRGDKCWEYKHRARHKHDLVELALESVPVGIESTFKDQRRQEDQKDEDGAWVVDPFERLFIWVCIIELRIG